MRRERTVMNPRRARPAARLRLVLKYREVASGACVRVADALRTHAALTCMAAATTLGCTCPYMFVWEIE